MRSEELVSQEWFQRHTGKRRATVVEVGPSQAYIDIELDGTVFLRFIDPEPPGYSTLWYPGDTVIVNIQSRSEAR